MHAPGVIRRTEVSIVVGECVGGGGRNGASVNGDVEGTTHDDIKISINIQVVRTFYLTVERVSKAVRSIGESHTTTIDLCESAHCQP